MESLSGVCVCNIVSANLGVPVCDVCAHVWECPFPITHDLTGSCLDCEVWPEILEKHQEECAARYVARWQRCSRGTLGRPE